MTSFSHRPFGSGHAYRYDLDQRVPAQPMVGEEYEIRVLADPGVDVVVRFADGTVVPAVPVAPESLVRDHGAQPAPAIPGRDGHLADAARAGTDTGGRVVWVAHAKAEADDEYRINNGEAVPLRPLAWRRDGGRLDADGAADVEWLTGSDGVHRVRFTLPGGAHVVGFGERFHALDQNGERLDTVVFEQYKRQGHRTYLPVPFFLVIGETVVGYHVDTTRRVWFDLTGDRIQVESEVDSSLTVHRFAGTPGSIVREFLERTGVPEVPPEWTFRPWMSGNEWNTQERVLAEVRRSLAEDIPVGAIVIEAWSDESTFVAFRDARYDLHEDGSPHRLGDFTFGEAWPDPKSMVDELHAAGVKVLLWQIPLIPTDRDQEGQVAFDAQALASSGLAVREDDGAPYHNRGWWFPGALLPDFTNPAAVDWWVSKRRYLVDELGIDGFKTDGGEHAWGSELRYADGTGGAETNNRFPLLYAAAYGALGKPTFSRAGFTGSGAHGLYWAGDEDSSWEGFRDAIVAGLTAGVSGIFWWGWDFGGFSGEIPDAELYLRSAAAACFVPVMQYHSEYNHHREPSRDRTPWNIARRTGDPQVMPVYRRFAKLRDLLVPYLVEQAAASVASGKPLMRPLFFDFPADERVWEFPSQFQLGDDLIVAPVTLPGATSWSVYLPAGEWVDLFDGSRQVGPVVVTRATPLDEIPAYRRVAGASTLDFEVPGTV